MRALLTMTTICPRSVASHSSIVSDEHRGRKWQKHGLKDRSRLFDIARGSSLECAVIHDVLTACHAIDPADNLIRKSQLLRVRAMLTKLVARNESVSEDPTAYQSTFEHEREEMPEQCDARIELIIVEDE